MSIPMLSLTPLFYVSRVILRPYFMYIIYINQYLKYKDEYKDE